MTLTSNYDVIIAGGGVMGCATAYYLLKYNDSLRVVIVEKDPSYRYASTVLSDGNVRVQFNIKENVQISQYGMEVLATFADDMAVGDKRPEVAARRQGNLFLFDDNGRYEAEQGLAMQQGLGCGVERLSVAQIADRYPAYAVNHCAGGTLGHDDGSVDPNGVLTGYRDKAMALGAAYRVDEVTAVLTDAGQVQGVRLASGEQLNAPIVLNGAGAWARQLMATVGVDLPVLPIMRQVFVVDTPLRPDGFLPSLFLPTGQYIIHEHDGRFVIGKSLPDDPQNFDFTFRQQRFIDLLWPELVDYLPAFEQLKVVSGWAGLYAVNTLDGNAILGEWPQVRGLYLANGFSGHGFQQCHAVGRYLAELILQRPPQLDLSIFTPQRILDNKPVLESAHRII